MPNAAKKKKKTQTSRVWIFYYMLAGTSYFAITWTMACRGVVESGLACEHYLPY
jgi:hypothetical protein